MLSDKWYFDMFTIQMQIKLEKGIFTAKMF